MIGLAASTSTTAVIDIITKQAQQVGQILGKNLQ